MNEEQKEPVLRVATEEEINEILADAPKMPERTDEEIRDWKKQIFQKAEDIKCPEDLFLLLKEIDLYDHDYDSIVNGCISAMIGVFNLINRGKSGGITGFQASFIAHEMISRFMMVKPPYRILDYNNLLYPQYENEFEKVIGRRTWNHLQEKAKNLILEHEDAHQDVINHWQSILNGAVPFGFRIEDEE